MWSSEFVDPWSLISGWWWSVLGKLSINQHFPFNKAIHPSSQSPENFRLKTLLIQFCTLNIILIKQCLAFILTFWTFKQGVDQIAWYDCHWLVEAGSATKSLWVNDEHDTNNEHLIERGYHHQWLTSYTGNIFRYSSVTTKRQG